MGFGSYDESEQQNQNGEAGADDAEGVSLHENQHDGEVTFETDLSTDELVDQLGSMSEDSADE